MRLEVHYKNQYTDGRARKLLGGYERRFPGVIRDLRIIDVYLIDPEPPTPGDLEGVFSDGVAQTLLAGSYAADTNLLRRWTIFVEVTARPGVADPIATSARFALRTVEDVPEEVRIQTARQYLFIAEPEAADPEAAHAIAAALHNPLIQQATIIHREEWAAGARPPHRYPSEIPPSPTEVLRFDLSSMDDGALAELSRARLLALSQEEMRAVREYYERPEVRANRIGMDLGPEATDVELEMIGQTWSEHCKHKIFSARITYQEVSPVDDGSEQQPPEVIDSVFDTYVRGTTDAMEDKAQALKSVFHDDSGVIQFDDDTFLCFKVETHNSPSALDPYGGAITGIVGVNRDIIGTGKGARPLWNTNVLCFADPDTPADALPQGLLHPREVMTGVHHGIVDGGNQSGIPVVAGAFVFDESFTGKPLVFCGTGGILPATIRGEDSSVAEVRPGDLAVMAGGRIGKDGIHGATFSSQELSESSPTSAVQIGDPITQKKMLDFLMEARDRGLYRGITDNGAGGLSSSLGEMAQDSGGVRIALDGAPLKYSGLAPWEILVSESQERMSLAVPPECWEDLRRLAGRRDVDIAQVGEFTDTGLAHITFESRTVGVLDLQFLHHGLPRMELRAQWRPPKRPDTPPQGVDYVATLLAILSDPTVASKEGLVRQYDQEVKGHSVIKPFTGVHEDAPSDGAVLTPLYDSNRGITVTHGICPRYGDVDAYHMAMCAVDEAVRAHVACGGDPAQVFALDNFCWPDPVQSQSVPDGEYKLAQLVRACRGLQDACLAYRLPLISGKDSMKNDTTLGGRRVSVRPTLLISLMGIVPDVRQSVTTDFKRAGDVIYLIGDTREELGGTMFERLMGHCYPSCPTVRPLEAMAAYQAVHRAMREGLVASCHDVSDGGLAVAVFESCLGAGLGADVAVDRVGPNAVAAMFSETASRLLLSVSPTHEKRLGHLLRGIPVLRLGAVCGQTRLQFTSGSSPLCELPLNRGEKAWKRW